MCNNMNISENDNLRIHRKFHPKKMNLVNNFLFKKNY